MINEYNELELEAIAFVEEFYAKIWTPEYTRNIISSLKGVLKDYQETHGLKAYVLGMSGGLDSAVVAALAADLNAKAMFIGINSSEEHRRLAELVATQYNVEYTEKFISEQQIENFKTILLSTENDRVAIGNLKARLRMIALYDLAKKHKACVLSTDNLSELCMGFWTLHGDVGDFGPIQYLNKGFELQYLAKELGIPEPVITQLPSDGLGVTEANTDEAQLGGNYRYVDTVLFAYFGQATEKIAPVLQQLLLTERAQRIIQRYHNSQFKRKDNSIPINKLSTPGRHNYFNHLYFKEQEQ